MATLFELIEEIDDGQADAEVIAAKVLDRIDCHEMVVLVAAEVRRLRRGDTRTVEQQFRGHDGAVPVREFLSQRFYVEGHGYVDMGKATAEHHRIRAATQRGLAEAITRDAEMHERAAELIERHGVKCLNQIKGEWSL